MIPGPPGSTLFPYTTLFQSRRDEAGVGGRAGTQHAPDVGVRPDGGEVVARSEEHTSELQSHSDLVCRLLLEKKKTTAKTNFRSIRIPCYSAGPKKPDAISRD